MRKFISGLLAFLVAVAVFLLLVCLLVFSISYLRGTMKAAGFLSLIFLNVLNIVAGLGGLVVVFLIPYLAGERAYLLIKGKL